MRLWLLGRGRPFQGCMAAQPLCRAVKIPSARSLGTSKLVALRLVIHSAVIAALLSLSVALVQVGGGVGTARLPLGAAGVGVVGALLVQAGVAVALGLLGGRGHLIAALLGVRLAGGSVGDARVGLAGHEVGAAGLDVGIAGFDGRHGGGGGGEEGRKGDDAGLREMHCGGKCC